MAPNDRRLAFAIVQHLDVLDSLRSVFGWGRAIGAAESTLRAWCAAAHVSPSAALDLRRGLAALLLHRADGAPPEDLLGLSDPRSVVRFLERCGPLRHDGLPLSPSAFCARQRAVQRPALVAEVQRLLAARGIDQ